MGSREGVCVCEFSLPAHHSTPPGDGVNKSPSQPCPAQGSFPQAGASRALAVNMCSASGGHGFLPFSLA